MKKTVLVYIAVLACALPAAAAEEQDAWAGFLDYAYVYSSAEPTALAERLDQYAARAGIELRDYIRERIEEPVLRGADLSEAALRRQAIGYLLDYIATGAEDSLNAALDASRALGKRLDRIENRYWVHYILAHAALHEGKADDFNAAVLNLWLEVVDLEAPYDTYRLLSLQRTPNAGFVAALPYVYENVARLIVIRAPRMGVLRGIDPLAGIVSSLADGRLGIDPDAVAPDESAADYVAVVAERLRGPESDGQSLAFTLSLLEAEVAHERMRTRLASEGFSKAALEAIHVAAGAYELTLASAGTLQGQVAVYTRALRQVGEVYAAKRRLGVEPHLLVPFSVERAMEIYGVLDRERESWEKHGYRENGREAYAAAMAGLWEEIQEASFNVAEYHVALGLALRSAGDPDLEEAAAHHARALSFFRRYVDAGKSEGIPDSAYFAAHRASRGIGETLVQRAGGSPSVSQLELASHHYLDALSIHPLDPALWFELAITLERQGRESEFLSQTKPIAERVTQSAALETWLAREAEGSEALTGVRRAFANDLTLMYLGFAGETRVEELELELATLSVERTEVLEELESLEAERERLARERADALAAAPASPDPELADELDELSPVSAAPRGEDFAALSPTDQISKIADRIAELRELETGLTSQIEARTSAFPLFTAALEAAPLTRELAVRRTHPVHALLRRLYREAEGKLR